MKLTICIAGKNNIAVNGLRLLHSKYKEHNICFLPNPIDDGIHGWQLSLKKAGQELGIREQKLENLYQIKNLLFISLEYSKIVKTTKFLTKKLFNIHFSLLPKYKGMFTSSLPLLYGDEYSGVTLHKIDDGIDTGNIIDQIKFNISSVDSARDLYFKYLENGLILLKKNIDDLINDTYKSIPQPPINTSYFSKNAIDYKNLRINFYKTAFEVRNQFRAFTFREYQMPKFENWEIFKVQILGDRSKFSPGTKVAENDEIIIVATIDYDLKLYKDYYAKFWQICELGNFSKFNSLISKIKNINLSNFKGWNAIIIATYNGHIEIVKKLIELGADINTKNKNGTTLLMYALNYYQRSNDLTLFRFFLELGADIVSTDRFGNDIKHYIVKNKCESLMALLD